jgi:hypothetical protein
MALRFGGYSEVSEVMGTSSGVAQKQSFCDIAELDRLLKKNKKLKHKNKKLQQTIVSMEWEQPKGKNDLRSKATGKEEKPFLSKLGDAFIKALPNLLIATVPAIIKGFFGWLQARNQRFATA